MISEQVATVLLLVIMAPVTWGLAGDLAEAHIEADEKRQWRKEDHELERAARYKARLERQIAALRQEVEEP